MSAEFAKIEIPNVGIFIKIISICSVQLSVKVRPYGLLEILLKSCSFKFDRIDFRREVGLERAGRKSITFML